MKRKLLKLSFVCVTGALILSANPKTAKAYEEGVAGYVYDKDSSSSIDSDGGISILSFSSGEMPIPGFNNLGIANVDTNLCIRSGPGEDKKIIGKLPKNAGCEIIEEGDGWTKISAETSMGNTITGYVKSEYLLTGSEALRVAKVVGSVVATSKVNGLYIRDEASTESKFIDQMAKGEELIVVNSNIVTEDQDHSKWVEVQIDSDDKELDTKYVAKEYVDLSFQLPHAVSIQELQYGSGVSQTRVNLVSLAKDHLGEAYVWGGTSLGHGVDCSGFTQAIYRQFGITIPRVSRDQARRGDSVSASQLKPGDLVFYGSSSYINHVAIYIGNGQVIHASNHRDGIKISNMYYRTPVKFVRYLSN